MSQDLDPEAAARLAAGDGPDQDGDEPDLETVDQEDAGDEWDVSESIKALLITLVAAPERGPTHRTFSEQLDVDEGAAHILDGIVDIVLDVVDVGEEIGETVGPAGKIAVGVSRLDWSDQDGAGDEPDQDGDDLEGEFSQDAQELLGGGSGV
jgi:hypothetical protein